MAMPDPKECFTDPHLLLHNAAGLGLGFLLASLVPALAGAGVVLGIIFLVIGLGGEFFRGTPTKV